MFTHTIPTTHGTLCPRSLQPLLVIQYLQVLNLCMCIDNFQFCLIGVSAGTLISHEKLLLQINTEREMGNMDYKLGQVNMHISKVIFFFFCLLL